MAKKNPIFYKDLIAPDKSIDDLIKSLEKLDKEFAKHLDNIQKEALKLTKSLKGVSGATEDGRQKTKKAATDAEKLAEAQRKLAQAQSENAQKLAELREQLRQQNQANKNAAKINMYAEGSYNRLSAQYAENKLRLNAMTQAERDAAEASEGLVTKTKELYERMKDLQAETGKMQLNVGNYAESVKQALGINNKFGDSLLALGKGGEEAKKAMVTIKDGTKALGKTLLGLMKNPAFLAIGGVAAAGTAFKFWYDYNAGLVEATRLTQQFTGKEGGDLKRFRVEVQSTADTFNHDFKEVLISANAVAKQFGIDVDTAMEYIQKGFLAGADATGEYLDILKEYPAYFKEAGIGADQFIAIISQTTKSGIFSDKGVDAIKEANLRLREMTASTASALEGLGINVNEVQRDLSTGAKTTFQIMQEVSAKLSEFPEQSAVVGTAIADIFGGAGEDAGLQYLKTLKDISTDLDVAKEKGGEMARLQERQLESTKRLDTLVSVLFDRSDGGFQRLKTSVSTFVNDTLADLIEGIIKVYNYFVELYNESIGFRAIWSGITAVVKSFFDTLGNLINASVEQFKALGSIIEGVFTFDIDTFTKGLEEYGRTYKNFLDNQRKDFTKNVQQSIEDAKGKIEPLEIPLRVKKEEESGEVGVVPTIAESNFSDIFKEINGGEPIPLPVTIEIDPKAKLPELPLDSMKSSAEAFEKDMENLPNKFQRLSKRIKETLFDDEGKPKSVYDMLGFDLSDAKKEAITTSTEFAKQQLNEIMEARVQLAEVAVQKAHEETEEAEKNLDRELNARANGYASNVEFARKELAEKKKNEQKALKDKAKAQKQQAAIQSVQQIGNLVTATSLIWSQLGFPAAIPAVALMWGSFAASKIMAARVTKAQSEKYAEGTVELLQGGSHASGHDIDLGTKKDGTRRRAEGGEFFAVINKRNSAKYRKQIPSLINALNNGTFPQDFMQAFSEGGNLNINVTNRENGLGTLRDDVRAIREQGDSRVYEGRDGMRVVEYKNLTRRIR